MRVSQRVDYSLRALVLLAGQPPGVYVVAGDVARALHLPRRFVEQQVTALSRAGIVECRRGVSGGCRLGRPARSVSVRDVVIALEGDVLDVPRQPNSASAELWQQTALRLSESLSQATVDDLLQRQREIDSESAPVYDI